MIKTGSGPTEQVSDEVLGKVSIELPIRFLVRILGKFVDNF